MKSQKRKTAPPSMIFEELEPRILYSADGATLVQPGSVIAPAEVRVLEPVVASVSTDIEVDDWQIDAVVAAIQAQSLPVVPSTLPSAQATAAGPVRHELVFVDAGVDDSDELVSNLLRSVDAGRQLDIIFLDASRDGVDQISDALASRTGLDAIHLVSHGADGSVRLGASALDFDTLLSKAARIRGWGQALGEDADILIYGCDVAASQNGRNLIDALGRLTGADVAGSDDLTGSAQRGGDWDLEYAAGSVDRAVVFGYGWQFSWTGVLATYTVTNTNDSGAGSLRQAITNANANGGADSIDFNIAGTGIHTITLSSALPSILDTVSIDATTDDSYAANGGRPAIVVSGGGTVSDIFQLWGGSDGSTIRGFVLQNYTQAGINIGASDGNTVAGNWIGLNSGGTAAAGGVYGISLWNANNNVIGGATPADRNVLSGNSSVGIGIDTDNATSTGNVIKGNYIGTNAAGTASVGNAAQGIWVNAASNTIGGTSTDEGNVISGTTTWVGIQLEQAASNTLIAGNYIGLDAAGTSALANAGGGIYIESANNTIGGTTAAARNVIAGNGGVGLTLTGASATGNVVIGNYIGTNAAGTGDVNGTTASSGLSGVVMDNGATNNRIGTDADGSNDAAERNVISGNNWYGVELLGSGTSGNIVQGNYVGVDVTGLVALGNAQGGVSIWNGAASNRVGGGLSGAGNVISGNETGVLIANGVSSNKVQGNIIGLGADGSTQVGNSGAGIYFYRGGSATLVTGNLVGTDGDGSNDSGERNVISANLNGVVMADAEITGNTVAGNYIGTDSAGVLDRGNTVDGVRIEAGANANTIGGTTAARRNVVSGNDQDGIQVDGEASDNNIIRGNYVGVNALGSATIGNGGDGVFISGGADSTVVGGSLSSGGNLIAGNGIVGVEVDGASSGTTITGNIIGTDLPGTQNWGHQQSGVMLDNGATNTMVGGAAASFGNIIAFSGQGGVWDDGIDVLGNATTGNAFIGNSIYGSVGQAIDLGNDGADSIDVGDVDTGPNTRLNTLSLTAATTDGSTVSLTGSYSGAANTYYRLEVYANASTDDGEARTLVHTANMPIGAGGTLTATYSFSASVAAGSKLTATVTSTNATYTTFFSTSEVSDLVVASAPNQAPSGTNGTMTATENLTYTFSGSEFGFSDPDGNNLMRVWFDTLPASGTLKFNGVAFAAGNFVAASDITNGLLTYTPAANLSGNGIASFTFRVQDDGGTALGGSDTDASANTLTVNITSVSSTPVNSVPGAQNTNEDTNKVFSSANGNQITITDVDAGALVNQVTLSVGHGSLTLNGTSGLTFVTGDGTADASMTFRGLAADINAALDGLSYSPAADYNGADALTVATQDAVLLSVDIDASLKGRYAFEISGALGTDTSPAAGFTGTVTNVTAVNDGTRGNVLGLAGNSYVQTTGHFGNPSDITLAAWVNLTTADSNGAEIISLGDSIGLRADSGGKLKGFYWDGTAYRFFETVATLAGTGWRHVALTFDDTGNAQKLYLDGSVVATTAFTGSISYTLGADSFIGTHANGGTTTDFTGRIDDARVYSRALTGGEIAALAADLNLVDTDTVALSVAAINDQPTDLLALPGVTATDIIGSYSFNASDALDRDDSGNGATITFTGGSAQTPGPTGSGALYLTGGQYGNIAGITTGGPTTIAGWVRFDTTALWQRVIDLGQDHSTGIGNIYVGREGGTNNLTFTIETDFGSVVAYRATATGAITNGTWMHFAATVDATGDMNLYVNGTLAGHGEGIVPTVGVRTNNFIGKSNWPDPDFVGAIDDLLIANGAMTPAQIAALYQQSAGFQVAENVTNGTVVGTVVPVDADGTSPYGFSLVDSASGRFAIDANGEITVADGTQLNYEAAASHNITVRVTDSGGLFYDEVFAVALTDVNEAPSVSVPAAQTTPEDTAKVFSPGNGNQIAIVDVDAGGVNNEVTLSVTHGTLTLSGTAGLTFVTGDGTADATITVRGTAAAINAALNGMSYLPASDYNGADTLTLTAKDSQQLALEIDANLQGRYTFEDSVADVAPGTSQDGVLVNGATYVTDGTRGRVLSLDGVNDYVQITGTFGNPSEITIGGWVNLASAGSRREFISLSDHVHIALDDTGGVKGSVQTGAGTWDDLTSGQFIAGTGWHHVMYTYSDSGNVHSLYIDGVKVATEVITASAYWTGATDTFIGRHPTSGLYPNAMIDDVRIFDRALTSSEVAELATTTTMSATGTVAMTVTAVNDAPALSSLNGTPAYTENGASVVLDANVTVSDVELSAAGTYQGATLSLARNGGANAQDQLTFDGVTVTTSGANVLVSGVVVGTYTFTGGQMDISFGANATQARVDTLMQNIKYANSSDAPPASVQIDWTFNDGSSGAQGSGGALSTSGSVVVTITAVNDAPALANTALALTVWENAGAPSGAVGMQVSAVTGGISDLDTGAVKGIAVTATDESHGTWHYSTDGGSTWNVVGAVSNVSALLLADDASTRLYFAPTNGYLGTSTSALTFRAWDQSSGAAGTKVTTASNGATTAFSTATDTVDVTVTAVNHAPVAVADSASGNEDTNITGNVLSNDTDNENDALTATLVAGPAHGSLILNANGTFTYTPDADWNGTDGFQYLVNDGSGLVHFWGLEGNGTDVMGGANGTLTNGPSTIAGQDGNALQFDGVDDYVVLPDISYGSEFTLSFDFRVTDNVGTGLQYFYSHGAAPSLGQPNTVQVAMVEDAYAVVGQRNHIVTTVWDSNDTSGQIFSDVSALIGDGQWHHYTVTVATGVGTRVYVDGVLAGTQTTGGDAINPTGNAHFGARADLDATRFLNAGSAMDSVALYNRALSDAEVASLTAGGQQASVTLTVNPVNDPPAFSNLNGTPTYTEGGAAVVLDANVTIGDVELDAASSYQGSTLTLVRNGGANAEDVLAFDGVTVTTSGADVLVSGVVVGTYTSTGGQMDISFGANATNARVNTLMQNIRYSNSSDAPPATVQIDWTFSDGNAGAQGSGGALSATGSATVTINALNDAPQINVVSPSVTTEDTNHAFSTLLGNAITIGDPDAGSAQMELTATALNGTLTLGGVGGLSFIVGDGTADSTMTFRGTVNAINAALDGITYAPDADYHGSAGLDFSLSDLGNSGGGGAQVVTATQVITVTPVADTPSVTNASTNEDTQTSSGLVISRNAGDGAEVTHFKVTGITGGTLYLNDGTTVIANGNFITFAQGNAGLRFTPTLNATTNGSFVVQASISNLDAGLGGGTVTATITVSAVNDAPTGLPVITGTPTEDQVLTADTSGIADADGLNAFSYQWLRDGVAIAGALSSTYTLGDADVGALITVEASYVDGYGTLETLTSVAVGPIANVNDAPTGSPTISGTATEDQTLTANTGLILDADGLTAFGYQWLRDGVAILGATANTYTLGDADVGTNISVTVSYTDGHGTAEALTSASVGPVANINDAPSGAPIVTGTSTEHQTLTADTTTIGDVDGLGAFNYQWLRDGVDVSGETADTYLLTAADIGKTITVRVNYVDGYGATETLTSVGVGPVANFNDAPTGAPVVTGIATEDQTLSVDTTGIGDADGLGTLFYQWLRNGSVIAGATGSSYVLGDADVGANISVQVDYTDGQGAAETLTSASVGPVANVNDAPTGLPTITGTTTENQTLTADITAIADADGLGTFSYQWLRNGSIVVGETNSTYVLGNADVGTTISVQVDYTDGQGSVEVLTSSAVGPIANVNDAPTGLPVITGTVTEDQTLTADTASIVDADGGGAYTYQWLRDGNTIGGATAATYTLGDADVGASISVTVQYTDGHGTLETLTSVAVGPVANVNDAPTGSPTISGTATEDQILTADTSAIVDIDGVGTFSYQWLRDGLNILGANAATYTLDDADVNANISVTVSYTDGHGTLETLTSAAVGPVANVNDVPTGAPVVLGTPTEDQTLTADISSVIDADGMPPPSYQWLRDGQAIAGATLGTYVLGDADVGAAISVQLSWVDLNGTAESLTSAAVGPIANVNDAPTGVPVVSGSPTEDQVLTADISGIGDADGLGTFNYQWMRNGVAVVGATSNTYTLGDADVGTVISVLVGYTDGNGTSESLTSAAVGPIANINDAPIIVSNGGGATANISVAENSVSVANVAATDVDIPVDTLTYSIVGGADQALFSIDINTGALVFTAAPDAEAPADANGDGIYDVVVQVDDGNGGVDTQAIAVGVTDVNEFAVGPLSDANIAANQVTEGAATGTVVGVTAFASDADATALVTYSLTNDAGGRFAIDATTGVITVANGGLLDASLSSAHVIDVLATSSDGTTSTVSLTVDVNYAPVVAPPVTDPPINPTTDPSQDPTANPPPTVEPPTGTPPIAVQHIEDPQEINGRLIKAVGDHDLEPAATPLLRFAGAQEQARGPSGGSATGGAIDSRAELRIRRAPFRVEGATFLMDKLGIDWRVAAMTVLQQDWFGLPTGSHLETQFEDLTRQGEQKTPLTVATAAKIGGAVASAGVVAWVLRSGGLLTSLLVSTPAWRHLDPIPVLAPDEDKPDWGNDPDNERDREERAALRLFRSEHADGTQDRL